MFSSSLVIMAIALSETGAGLSSNSAWSPRLSMAPAIGVLQQSEGPGDWTLFENGRYHYRLSYPAAASVGAVPKNASPSTTDVIFVSIDPRSDPIYICAGDNKEGWSAEQLFKNWKDKPPRNDRTEFPCTDYPSYARWQGSATEVSGLTAYKVTSFRGRYETVCTYVAGRRTVLAACLPAEDPKGQAWEAHVRMYDAILVSLKILE